MSKSKQKLSVQQQKWLENLEWLIIHENDLCANFSALRSTYLEDIVKEGRYVLISYRGDKNKFKGYTLILGAATKSVAVFMDEYNSNTKSMIIDLETMAVLQKTERRWEPDLDNLIKKMESAHSPVV